MKRNSLLWKRIVGCGLAMTMLATTVVGCGAKDTTTGTSESTSTSTSAVTSESTPSSEVAEEKPAYPMEGVKLTLGMVEEANVTQAGYDTIIDTPFGKAWQEATGVELEIVQYANTDALNLAIAGGEVPDILYFSYAYPGGVNALVADGVAVSVDDYLEEYAPEYKAVLDADKDVLKTYSTLDGKVSAFGFIKGDPYLQTYKGMVIREDWLKDLNMEVPRTPEQLKEVLVAFKEQKGAKGALSFAIWETVTDNGVLSSGFGLPSVGWYQEDGKAHWGATEPEYKELLMYMRDLYEEGLFETNFMTMGNNDFRAAIMNGDAGVIYDSAGGGVGTIMSTMSDDPTFSVTGIAPLVEQEGDIAALAQYDTTATSYLAVVTNSCKDVESAVRFLNYGYTEEGSMLMNFGIEGESYNMENGYPTYTDYIMNNPEGLSKAVAMTEYMRAQSNFPFVQRKEYMEQYSNLPQQQAVLTAWSQHQAKDYYMGHISALEEDKDEYSKVYTDFAIYVGEFAQKFIVGDIPETAYETDYIPAMEKMNAERAIELMQKALDAYNAR